MGSLIPRTLRYPRKELWTACGGSTTSAPEGERFHCTRDAGAAKDL